MSAQQGTGIMLFAEQMKEVHVNIEYSSCKKNLFYDSFVKHVFQYFEPFHANLAIKFQNTLKVSKQLEFYPDSKTNEKNAEKSVVDNKVTE